MNRLLLTTKRMSNPRDYHVAKLSRTKINVVCNGSNHSVAHDGGVVIEKNDE